MCDVKEFKLSVSNLLDIFGRKKMDSIERFIKKFLGDETFHIRNIKIQKKLETYLALEEYPLKTREITTLEIYYYSAYSRGMYWNITTKLNVEKMILDVFSLENLGINNVFLSDV
jgi:hypothetical protein